MKSAGSDFEPENVNVDDTSANRTSKSSASSNVAEKLLSIAGYNSSTSEGKEDLRRRLSTRDVELGREAPLTEPEADRDTHRRRPHWDEEDRRFSSRHDLDDPDYEREDRRRHDERMVRGEGGRVREGGRVARLSRDEESRVARSLRDEDGRAVRVSRDEEGRIVRVPRDEDGRVARPPRDEESRVARTLREDDGRVARPLRDDENRIARPLREDDGRLARSSREDDGRVTRPLRDEDSRVARPLREDDNRVARPSREEEGRVARSLRDDDNRVARPSREEEGRVVTSERRELSREEDVRSPSLSRRSTGQTPPSDPRLKRFRSGPRTPSRSPPPPTSG